MPGSVILLNGASSSGKSTLAHALQQQLPAPFWHYSIDHLLSANILPQTRIDSGNFPWTGMRQQFFEGFHNSIPAFAEAGNHLIVEHIVESQAWMHRLLRLLHGLDVFFVGLHCPLEELERRERIRGNRKVGEARADIEVTHTFGVYDFECSSTEPALDNAARLIKVWQARSSPCAFDRMTAELRSAPSAA